jgi:uncharacterized phage protein (TIGR02216 family)
MRRIDWAGLVRAGLGRLQLHPEAFWRLTPVELAILLGLEGAQPPLTRTRLEALAAAFPDLSKEAADG